MRETRSENKNNTYLCSAIAEHEREELQSSSGENNEGLTTNAEKTFPAVVEVATQTRNTGENISIQFWSSPHR